MHTCSSHSAYIASWVVVRNHLSGPRVAATPRTRGWRYSAYIVMSVAASIASWWARFQSGWRSRR